MIFPYPISDRKRRMIKKYLRKLVRDSTVCRPKKYIFWHQGSAPCHPPSYFAIFNQIAFLPMYATLIQEVVDCSKTQKQGYQKKRGRNCSLKFSDRIGPPSLLHRQQRGWNTSSINDSHMRTNLKGYQGTPVHKRCAQGRYFSILPFSFPFE